MRQIDEATVHALRKLADHIEAGKSHVDTMEQERGIAPCGVDDGGCVRYGPTGEYSMVVNYVSYSETGES